MHSHRKADGSVDEGLAVVCEAEELEMELTSGRAGREMNLGKEKNLLVKIFQKDFIRKKK